MPEPRERRRAATAVVAILLAACAALAGARRVAVDFSSSRERVLNQETWFGPGNPLVRTVPVRRQPLSVVIAHARAGGVHSVVEVRANGRVVAREEVGARRTRIDAQVPEALAPGSAVELSCAPGPCAATHLELANLHGFSSGLFNALFLPASRHDFRPLPWWLMAALFVPLAATWMPPGAGRHPRTETAVAALALLAFVLALVSPLVSRYTLALRTPTFLLCLVMVFGASARRRYLSLRARATGRNPAIARWLDIAAVTLAILCFSAALVRYGLFEVNQGNYTGFLYITDHYANAPVLDEHPDIRASLKRYPSGYDGQFMFLMAFDPLLARFEPAQYARLADAPGYRYGRIGFSLLTVLFSGGRPGAFAPTMVWLIAGGLAMGGAFLAGLAIGRGASAWQALPYVLIPGFLVSVGTALPEPIAAALLLAGLLAYERGRTWLAVAAWAVSLFVRETGAVLILVIIGAALLEGPEHRRRVLPLFAAFVPLALWRVYVGLRLFPAFGRYAFGEGAEDMTWPFAGFVELWSVNDAAHGHGQAFNLWFPVVLIAMFVLALGVLRVRRNAVAAAAVAYGLLAVCFNYRKIWTWAGNGERVTFEFFVLLLVALLPFGSLPRPLRWAVAAFAIGLFAYDFRVATYATWFRSGLVVFH